jgi:hypothetical protein
MHNIQPELIGIFNIGVATSGGSGGGGGGGGTSDFSITIPAAAIGSMGVVQVCNSSNSQVTSETVTVVPTQYYVQTEINRIDGRLDSAVIVEPISSFVEG